MIKKIYKFIHNHPAGIIRAILLELIISIFLYGQLEWIDTLVELCIYFIILILYVGMDQRWCEDD